MTANAVGVSGPSADGREARGFWSSFYERPSGARERGKRWEYDLELPVAAFEFRLDALE